MYSNPKIPAPFCGRACKKAVSVPSMPPKKPMQQREAPVPTKAAPIKALEEKRLPQQKNSFCGSAPLLAFLILFLFFEKKEG